MSSVNGKTKVFAVLGDPIEQSLSPAMYNAAFSALGMNYVYLALRVQQKDLAAAVQGLKALGIQGGNVTMPLKKAIISYLDELTQEARLIGAVNTFYWQEGLLWGDNTDGSGFLRALLQTEPDLLKSQGTLIMGAGGAARAVGVALALAGMKDFTLINRTSEKAQELAALLASLGAKASVRKWHTDGFKEAFSENRLLINATPLGMYAQEKEQEKVGLPIEEGWFTKGQLAVDLIYKPRETDFLQKAKSRGCKTYNGLPMLLYQGIIAFEKWSGEKAPIEVMANELERWA